MCIPRLQSPAQHIPVCNLDLLSLCSTAVLKISTVRPSYMYKHGSRGEVVVSRPACKPHSKSLAISGRTTHTKGLLRASSDRLHATSLGSHAHPLTTLPFHWQSSIVSSASKLLLESMACKRQMPVPQSAAQEQNAQHGYDMRLGLSLPCTEAHNYDK